jgi:apolipoprotein D and lipocalin family protein
MKFPVLLCLALAACATTPLAPQPTKPLDAATFFTGRWYEIARTPTQFTVNCVAGTTDFYRTDDGRLIERDECRQGSPEGAITTFEGSVLLDSPGDYTKFTTHYVVFHILPIAQTYWILDNGPDWFIVSDPGFSHVDLLSRHPQAPKALVARLTAEARTLGYDTSKLEFPPQFPPGEGFEPAQPN